MVPRAPIIYVVGDVGRPSGLLVDNGTLTVLQALALAGGTNRTAKMGGVRIIRKGSDGNDRDPSAAEENAGSEGSRCHLAGRRHSLRSGQRRPSGGRENV